LTFTRYTGPDPLVPIEETAETLLELQREGKILALGVSNYSPEQPSFSPTIQARRSLQS
jgi:aryl-alcohol dehydrogenase-like predicted oxidoreductase